jgi:hypothetical protein
VVQFLARSGVDIQRIQALVRHSSGAIIHCLCMSHIGASSTVAEEAALGRTFETERGEIRAMSAQLEAQRAEAARLISDADHMSIRMPIPMDSLVLEAPAVVSATSVRTSRAVGAMDSATRTDDCRSPPPVHSVRSRRPFQRQVACPQPCSARRSLLSLGLAVACLSAHAQGGPL